MPGIGSDPCPLGAAAGPRSVLPATEESLHSEQAWPQGPEETRERDRHCGLGHQSVGSEPAAVGEEGSDNSPVRLRVLPLGRRPAFSSWSQKFLGAWGYRTLPTSLHSWVAQPAYLVTCQTLGFYAWGTQFCEGQDMWLQSGSWVAGAPQAAERWSASRDLCWERAMGFVSPRFTRTDELLDRP